VAACVYEVQTVETCTVCQRGVWFRRATMKPFRQGGGRCDWTPGVELNSLSQSAWWSSVAGRVYLAQRRGRVVPRNAPRFIE